MIQLQNNFTTPEQSKRLLELGVPADSADMIWDGVYDYENGWDFEEHPSFFDETYTELCKLYREGDAIHILPCWSVGRLMEIFDICNLYELHKFSTRDWSVNIKSIMEDYEVAAEEKMLDFSKLED